jgi:hypothetical protein
MNLAQQGLGEVLLSRPRVAKPNNNSYELESSVCTEVGLCVYSCLANFPSIQEQLYL